MGTDRRCPRSGRCAGPRRGRRPRSELRSQRKVRGRGARAPEKEAQRARPGAVVANGRTYDVGVEEGAFDSEEWPARCGPLGVHLCRLPLEREELMSPEPVC